MTTIATDGFSMSADGRTTAGGDILSERSVKIWMLPDGSVIGGAGVAPAHALAINAIAVGLIEGKPPELHKGKFTLLRLMPDLTIRHYYQSNLDFVEIDAPASIGSGSSFARGAMMTGASPAAAIKIAKKTDAYTGGRIRSLTPRP